MQRRGSWLAERVEGRVAEVLEEQERRREGRRT